MVRIVVDLEITYTVIANLLALVKMHDSKEIVGLINLTLNTMTEEVPEIELVNKIRKYNLNMPADRLAYSLTKHLTSELGNVTGMDFKSLVPGMRLTRMGETYGFILSREQI